MKLQLADGVRESELRRSENEIQRQARVLAQQARDCLLVRRQC